MSLPGWRALGWPCVGLPRASDLTASAPKLPGTRAVWARVQGHVCACMCCVCVCGMCVTRVRRPGQGQGGGGRVSASPQPSPTTAGNCGFLTREGDGGQPPVVPPSPHPPALQWQEPCALSPVPQACSCPSSCPALSPITWSDPASPVADMGPQRVLRPQGPSLPGGGCSP